MKRRSKITFIIAFFFIPTLLVAQKDIKIIPEEANKAILKASGFFTKNEIYSVRIKYESFAGHYSDQSMDVQYGFVKRYKNSYQTNLMNIHSVQNERLRITIDSLDKVILVSKPDSLVSLEAIAGVNLELLKKCKEIRKIEKASGIIFKIILPSGLPYEKLDMEFDKNERFLKIKIYMSEKVALDPDDENSHMELPRLEISFSGYTTSFKYTEAEFNPLTYVKIKGNEIQPVTKYQHFEIKDSRYFQ